MKGSVLYICGGRSFHSANPGRKIFSVINCWKRMGFEVEHLCGGDVGSKSIDDAETQNSDVKKSGHAPASNYGAASHHNKRVNKIGLLSFFVRSASEIKDCINDSQLFQIGLSLYEKKSPDIIWERSSRLHWAGLKLAQHLSRPFVLEWKDNLIPYRWSLLKVYAEHIEKKKILEADAIVVESEVLRSQLGQQYPTAKEKIVVAHNAVDREEFVLDEAQRNTVRQRCGISEESIVVGYLGSYAFYHDSIRLVMAARVLRKHLSINFLLVGDGKDFSKVRNYADDNQLTDTSVFFHSPVPKEQVPMLLSAMDVAVLPGSTDIICPIKVQEYMALGLASVVPDYPCNREVIDDGDTGLVFEPGNAQALAEKLEFLCLQPDLRKTIAIKARQTISERFSWEHTWGKALNQVFEQTRS